VRGADSNIDSDESGGRTMRVWVDQDVCTGDGLCEELAPRVFQLADGISFVRDSGGASMMAGADASVPDAEVDGVLEAAEQCPGECIFIEV
jgi:ferredoxin